jgi:lipopolysaccharide transport system permease protein
MLARRCNRTLGVDEIVLEAGRAERQYWRDLWQYRELLQVLAWRDVSVRYKQTLLGIAWAVLRPFLTMAVFTIVFGKLAGLPSVGSAPYALLVFAGTLAWTFFSSALNDSSNSVLNSSNLISKVYFPRMIIPVSVVAVALVDLAFSLVVLLGLFVWYKYIPGWQLALLPAFVLLGFAVSLGPGLFLAALTVKYRDFRFITPFIAQLGLYISPVGFSSEIVPSSWRIFYSLNPMVGVIDGFRWCVLGGSYQLYLPSLVLSIVGAVFFMWLGVRQFRRTERSFADVI